MVLERPSGWATPGQVDCWEVEKGYDVLVVRWMSSGSAGMAGGLLVIAE